MDVTPSGTQPKILASVTRRFVAKALDCAISVAAFVLIKFAADALATYVPAVSAKAGLLSAFVVGFAYLMLADALPNGQSLAKRWLDIAVVDRKTFKGCTLSQAFTRNSGALVVFDWMWIFMEGRTRLGDMFANTIVIQTGKLSHQVRSFADVFDEGKGNPQPTSLD